MTNPVAFGLWNPRTGKMDARRYQAWESAVAGAKAHSNRWRTLIAVPVFLTPQTEEEVDERLERRRALGHQ